MSRVDVKRTSTGGGDGRGESAALSRFALFATDWEGTFSL